MKKHVRTDQWRRFLESISPEVQQSQVWGKLNKTTATPLPPYIIIH